MMKPDVFTAVINVPSDAIESPAWPDTQRSLVMEAVEHCRESGGQPGEGLEVEIRDAWPDGRTLPGQKILVIRIPSLREVTS